MFRNITACRRRCGVNSRWPQTFPSCLSHTGAAPRGGLLLLFVMTATSFIQVFRSNISVLVIRLPAGTFSTLLSRRSANCEENAEISKTNQRRRYEPRRAAMLTRLRHTRTSVTRATRRGKPPGSRRTSCLNRWPCVEAQRNLRQHIWWNSKHSLWGSCPCLNV